MTKRKEEEAPAASTNVAQDYLDKYNNPMRVQRKRINRGGRPLYTSLLHDEEKGVVIMERFAAAIELGMFMGPASGFAGVSFRVVKKWLHKGRALREQAEKRAEAIGKRDGHMPKVPEPDDSDAHVYWRFLERYEEAVSLCQARCWNAMNKAVNKGDWRAAKAMLEAHERGGFTQHATRDEVDTHLRVATDFQGVSVDALEKALLGQTDDLTVIDVKPTE